MKTTLRLSLILASCYSLSCHPNSQSSGKAIVDRNLDLNAPGAKATVALLQKAGEGYSSFCTGTLVAPRLVLTSAMCLRSRSIQDIKVLFGNSVSDSRSVVLEVESGLAESSDTKKHYPNRDLAWLKLQSDAPAGALPIEVLRSRKYMDRPRDEELEIYGFGQYKPACAESDTSCSGQKRGGLFPFLEKLDLPHFINLFTVGSLQNRLCRGDEGGPAIIRVGTESRLLGIYSGDGGSLGSDWGTDLIQDSNCHYKKSFFTGLAAYVDWIESSSGIKLVASADNGNDPKTVLDSPEISRQIWDEWEQYNNFDTPAWYTVQAILKASFSQYRRENRTKELLDFFQDSTSSNAFIKQSVKGLELNGVRADFDSLEALDAQIRDIRPLATLSELRGLVLKNQSIENFTPLSSMTSLSILKISQNYEWKSQRLLPLPLETLPPNLSVLELQGPLLALSGQLSFKVQAGSRISLTIRDIANFDISMISEGTLAQVSKLTLSGLKIKDLRWLSAATQLTELDLSNNEIEDIGPLLAQAPQLKILNLTKNKIASLATLEKFPALTSVFAISNPAQDGICPPTAESCALPWSEPKSFQEACLTTARWKANQKEWPEWNSLNALAAWVGLNSSSFEVNPANCIALEDRIKQQSTFSTPATGRNENLSRYRLDSVQLFTWFPQLTEILLPEQSIKDPSPLASLPALKVLDLWANPLSELKGMEKFPALKKLTISPVQSLSPLTSPTLEEIYFQRGYQTSRFSFDAASLGPLPLLKKLRLENQVLLNAGQLVRLNNLESLILSYLTTEDGPMQDLKKIPLLPRLKEISLFADNYTDLYCPAAEGGSCKMGTRLVTAGPRTPEQLPNPSASPVADEPKPAPTQVPVPGESSGGTTNGILEGESLPLILGADFAFPGTQKVYSLSPRS